MTPDFPFSPFYTHSRKGRRSRGGKGGETRRLRNDSEFCAPRTRAQRAQENSCCRSLYCLAPPPRRLGASNCPFPPNPSPHPRPSRVLAGRPFSSPAVSQPRRDGTLRLRGLALGLLQNLRYGGGNRRDPFLPQEATARCSPCLIAGGGARYPPPSSGEKPYLNGNPKCIIKCPQRARGLLVKRSCISLKTRHRSSP